MKMRVLWICGLPNEVRMNGWRQRLSEQPTPAWSWVLGHLPPEGVELHILCPVVGLVESRIDFVYLGAHWHCFRRRKFLQLPSYIRHMIACRRFVKKLRPDIIHGWGGETGFGFYATLLTNRAVVSVQGLLLLLYNSLSWQFKMQMTTWYGRYMVWRERLSYQRAMLLLVESNTSGVALQKYYQKRGVVVPQPLRAVFYQGRSNSRDDVPTFLYVGALTARKGVLDVVNAFVHVYDKSAQLIMIGDGEARDEVESLILERGLSSRITMKHNCAAEELFELMTRAHFFTLPSYVDTGPNALKEALASGLFPICYDNSGPHEYITRYCGYLCETGNVVAYAELMNKALANREGCLRISAEASIRIKKDLSKTMVWAKLRELYKEVV